MYEYSTKPGFCRTCHLMEPYYQAWATSSHRKYATCVTCHYPPSGGVISTKMRAMSQLVQYITRTYHPRPKAEVEDTNCLQKGCHETRLLQGKITMRGGEIQFDHTPHLKQLRRGMQLRCTSCHSQIMVGTHIEVTLTSCYDCHFKGHTPGRNQLPLAGCLSCHKPPSTPKDLGEGLTFNHADYINREGVQCIFCHVDSVSGDGAAPKERCFSCHNTPERLARYGDTAFIHLNHVTNHKIECQACHLGIEHKIHVEPLSEGTCNRCHEPSHQAVLDMYQGRWPGLDKPQPATMGRAGVNCIGCHQHEVQADPDHLFAPINWITDAKSCAVCHGEGFDDYIQTWKKDMNDSLARIEPLIASLKTKINSLPPGDPKLATLQALLKRAETEKAFLKYGHGVHNYDLASAKLVELEKALKEAQ